MPNRRKAGLRVIISGGGTGGHIFPAIAIANALMANNPKTEILFVGALGRMEMEKVPQAGYRIEGLPIAGLQRRLTWDNFAFPFKLFKSLSQAKLIIQDFQPDIVVGVGGYASGPVLWQAQQLYVPTVIQEQNSYAGLTNKILGRKADCICTAYEGMERFFAIQKIQLTGNPIRQDLYDVSSKRAEALDAFKLDPNKRTVLILGGSLGARTINESTSLGLKLFQEADLQVIWQTGKTYYPEAQKVVQELNIPTTKVYDFIRQMDLAYAVADLVISRAGAGTVSELCLVGKPVILIPSPNVSEDHQTKNAMALVVKGAAQVVTDADARLNMTNQAIDLINKPSACEQLGKNIALLAKPMAAQNIATIVENLARKSKVASVE